MIWLQGQVHINQGKFAGKRNKGKYFRFKNNNTTVSFLNKARFFE